MGPIDVDQERREEGHSERGEKGSRLVPEHAYGRWGLSDKKKRESERRTNDDPILKQKEE
jgi:hypothetical protein